MTDRLQILACDTEDKAFEAKGKLVGEGYDEPSITLEQVKTFIYDGETFSADGGNDGLSDKWIVIGRKPAAA